MRGTILAMTALCLPAFAAAQDDRDASEASAAEDGAAEPIIVLGDDAASTEPERRVVVGSRIARKPRFVEGTVATSTGTPGFTPGSGMDPAGGRTKTITKRECVPDREEIGTVAACILFSAIAAKDGGDTALASAHLRRIVSSNKFSAQERLAAAQIAYDIGKQGADMRAQEDALLLMLHTGALNDADTVMATRGLVSHALADGRRQVAHARLVRLDHMGAATANELANQAILGRELGMSDQAAVMRRAVAARTAEGRPVPAAWTAFAVQSASAP